MEIGEMDKARIMVVEDEGIVAHDIATQLANMGYEVVAVLDSGEEAVKKAGELQPDLLLMDIMLSGKMDGIEAAEIIRSRWAVPVVFLTAYADTDKLKRAKLIYPSGYVIKPFQPNDLKISIEISLHISTTEKAKQAAEKAMQESEERLRMTVEASLDAVIAVNAEGKIVLFNGAAEELFQYKEEEVLNQTVGILLREEASQKHQHRLEKYLKKGTGQCGHIGKRQEKIFRRKDGSQFEAEVSMSGGRSNGSRLVVLAIRDITERKKAEKSLQVSEARFRELIENINDVFYELNNQGIIQYVSPSVERLFGYSQSEAIGRSITDVLDPEHMAPAIKNIQKVMAGDTAVREYRARRKSGEICWIMVNSSPVMKGEQVVGIRGVMSDITERKRTEEALQLSEVRFRELAELLPETVFETDLQGTLTFVNKNAFERFGYTPEDFAGGLNLLDMVTPNDRGRALENMQRVSKGENIGSIEFIVQRKDRSIFPSLIHSSAITLDGMPAGVRGFVVDITEHKKAEDELESQYRTFKQVLNSLDALVYVIDMKTYEIVFINTYGQNIWGNVKEKICWQVLQEGQTGPCEFCTSSRLIGPDGNPTDSVVWEFQNTVNNRWYECRDRAINWPDGRIVRMEIATDITDRKLAEEALQDERRMFIGGPTVVFKWVAEEGWPVAYVSPNVFDELGYSAEDFINRKILFADIVHRDDLKRVGDEVAKYSQLGITSFEQEYRIVRAGGESRWFYDFTVVKRDDSGQITHYQGYVQDITERKEMEEHLLRVQKLESLGVLAGGIAHDFNNLMGIVQGYIELAQMELPSDHVSNQRLLAAMRSISQTRDLTSRLITFSRGGDPIMELFADARETLRDAVQKTIKGTTVKAKFNLTEKLWPVEMDELQVKQCFYNLTTNAIEAMPDGGTLTIRAENYEMTAEQALPLKEGCYIKITFTDEGPGIPEEYLHKVFDPYFTTKGMGSRKGMGLGLSVCHSVLKNHNGHISVESTSGEGTSFALYLPAKIVHEMAKNAKRRLPPGTGRVLIMDDDPDIRGIERAYLEQMGYEVTDVKDGQEAIDAYKKEMDSGNSFDLVMLDLTVHHGLGGLLVMERLLKFDPLIKAIIVSGSVNDPAIANYANYGFLGTITKPFKRVEINTLVEGILHG